MGTIDNMFSRSLTMVYISYKQVRNRDLLRAMRKKRAPLLPIMLFHHDNGHSHRASTTQETIDRQSIEVLGYPHYSPDLAPCDFFLFPTLKKILRGRQFDDVADLQRAVQSAIALLDHPHTRTVSIHELKGVKSAFHSKGSTLKRTNAFRQKLRKGM